MKILFTGGGTAGHINPAIAVANYVKEKQPDAEILFVGTRDGLESNLVPRAGYNIEYIDVQGFERRLSFGNVVNLFKIIGSLIKAKNIIKRFSPDVMLGTGGYVSGPVLYMGVKMKIPAIIHEQNALAGLTNKILAKNVDVVALAFDEGKKYFPTAKRIEVTGNPIRPSILKVSRSEARARLGLDERPFIVAFGGSLGAQKLNYAVADWICKTAKRGDMQIMFGTGKGGYYNEITERIKSRGMDIEKNKNIRIVEYIYDMELALNAADLAIVRCGAITLSEITALGKAGILIPSPNVAENHQEYNARAVENSGGGVVITDDMLSGDELDLQVKKVLLNEKYKEMGRMAKRIGTFNAAEKIYKIIEEIRNK